MRDLWDFLKFLASFLVPAILLVVLCACAVAWFAEQSGKPCYEEGRQAALHGIPVLACPYSGTSSAHRYWKQGWIDGSIAKEKE